MPAPLPATVALISHGWHTDLAIPADALAGPLGVFRHIFPGLGWLVVGFGKRTFMMAPVTGLGDLLVGPFPGPGAILALGLKADPARAYPSGTVVRLALTAAGQARLADFVWSTLRLDAHGRPVVIGPGPFPGGVFYATRLGYSGAETCNTWTADALHKAGLPISSAFDVFASQTMARAEPLSPGGACRIAS